MNYSALAVVAVLDKVKEEFPIRRLPHSWNRCWKQLRNGLGGMVERELLIDVSRLIWRRWKGRLPTGIDRVCLAYLQHFGPRAHAVVQWSGLRRILAPQVSDRLFGILASGTPGFRSSFLRQLPATMFGSLATGECQGKVYLNIGHTGLDHRSLPRWVRDQGLKAVYLVHDLIPVTNPEFCREGEADKHERRMVNALESAAGVIGNSQATLDGLAHFAEARGLAMPAQISAWISGHRIPNSVMSANMDRPYFVTVGTIEGRKNHILLLQLWRQLATRLGNRTPRLLIIGQRGWEAEHALAMLDRCDAIRNHVTELQQCEDAELARLVKGARALLMPSFVEGFGLPLVEALQLGTPVIASDIPVFREIASDIPTYLSPIDGAGWEREVLSFVQDGPERLRQLAAMPDFVPPDWPGHFALVEPWLKTL